MIRWVDDVRAAYQELGGIAHNREIVRRVKHRRIAARRSWPPNAESIIACVRTTHCAQAKRSFGLRQDLFRRVRRGVWRLKNKPKGKRCDRAN